MVCLRAEMGFNTKPLPIPEVHNNFFLSSQIPNKGMISRPSSPHSTKPLFSAAILSFRYFRRTTSFPLPHHSVPQAPSRGSSLHKSVDPLGASQLSLRTEAAPRRTYFCYR